MSKNKIYIFLAIMILIILCIATITCSKDQSPDKKEKWKEEVEQSNKDIKKESTVEDEKGSKQSEDIEDLDKQDKSIPVTLKGVVRSEATQDIITITINKETGHVEGEVTLWWYEEIEVYGEEGESHHSHRYTCIVKLTKGTILGTIDKKNNINATISGFVYSDYGYPESGQSTEEICSLCMEKIKKKPVNFILKGEHNESTRWASGDVLPNGWGWVARN